MYAAEIRIEEENCLLLVKGKCIAHLSITAEVRMSVAIAVDLSDLRNHNVS